MMWGFKLKINEIQTNDMWQEGRTWHLEQLWQKCKELNALQECGLKHGILGIKGAPKQTTVPFSFGSLKDFTYRGIFFL